MSKNIDQIFIANPITVNASTDLMYFGQSPYGAGNDAAMTYANFSAQFGAPYTASALTAANDTNVTLTLGGTPSTALLHAASITAGWTGLLSGTRGGTGVNNGASIITIGGNVTFSGASTFTGTLTGNTSVTFPTSGTLATTSQLPTPAALTETNDTNVTLTLGGTPSTALLQAVSITAGWSGQLAVSRGGTGVASVTTAPTVTAFAGWDANKNLSANALIEGYTTTATAAGTTTLTVGSTYQQFFTGTTTQAVQLPVTSTLVLGQAFEIVNNSTGVVTVQSSGGNTIQAMAASSTLIVTCILTSGTTAASWSASYIPVITPSPFTQSGSFSAYGPGASSTMGTSSLALGNSAQASGNNSFALGASATASASNTVAIGASAGATASGAIMISGGVSTASGTGSIGIGSNNVNSAQGLAIGAQSATGSGTAQICIGNGASAANGNYVIAIGRNATALGSQSIVLGYLATNSGSHNGVFIANDSNGAPAADTAANQWVHTFAGGFVFALSSSSKPVIIDANGNLINAKGTADQSYSLQTPATGFSITIGAGVKSLILNPAGTLATGTITMPASPIDGQEIRFSSSQIVTSLTVSANAGQTISNAPTTITAGQGFAYIYNLSGTNWFRIY